MMDFISQNHHKSYFIDFSVVCRSYLEKMINKENMLATKIRELAETIGLTNFKDMDDRCEVLKENFPKIMEVRPCRLISKI